MEGGIPHNEVQETSLWKIYESDYEYQLHIDRNNTIRDELIHFRDCIVESKIGTNSGEIGEKTIELIEATKLSLKEGRTIVID